MIVNIPVGKDDGPFLERLVASIGNPHPTFRVRVMFVDGDQPPLPKGVTEMTADVLPASQPARGNEIFKWMCRLADAGEEPFLWCPVNSVILSGGVDALRQEWEREGMPILTELKAITSVGLVATPYGVYDHRMWDLFKSRMCETHSGEAIHTWMRPEFLASMWPTNRIAPYDAVNDQAPDGAVMYHGKPI